MGKRVALTMGLHDISVAHYGQQESLPGCEPDATQVADHARSLGFDVRPSLLTQAATRGNFTQAMLGLAQNELDTGDLLWLHYSGHGSQIDDSKTTGIKDQTWCLYDAEILDKELLRLWAWFKPGVRILVTSDSCHSGSVTREIIERHVRDVTVKTRAIGSRVAVRQIPAGENQQVVTRNQGFYRTILDDLVSGPRIATTDLKATVKLLSGCRDEQLSSDLGSNGAFTRTMLDVLNEGHYGDTFMGLRKTVADRLVQFQQEPQLSDIGAINIEWGTSPPFSQ